jgi:hypothetical protein
MSRTGGLSAVVAACAAVLLALWAAPAWAGPAPGPGVTLSVAPASIAFPDMNPDLVPLITSTPSPVSVTVNVVGNGGGQWRLTIAASDDLRSGPDAIAASNVTWISSKTNQGWLAGGTLAVNPAQLIAGSTGNANNHTSNLTFRLANLWTFSPGTYSTTATLTLSAP